MKQDSKNKTTGSFFWSAIQRFGTRILIFISNIVLARLLSPADFGCVGLITVFINFSDDFINGGFASALIQKKSPTQADYSSVFYLNLSIALICYAILFVFSPAIAKFYHIPILCDILRIQGIVMIFNAFGVVQTNILQKQLNIKRLAIADNISSLLGSIAGIIAAYKGIGVWSLVIRYVGVYFFYVFFIWIIDSWKPSLTFSFKSIRELFKFGGFMLLSNITDTVYNNIQSLIIGRVFSDSDLGQFTQARKLEEIPVMGLASVVSTVSFPLYSKLQDDKESLLCLLHRNTKTITYLSFPLMVLLFLVSEPLMILLFGDKWLPAVPYFRILCISGLITTINVTNKDLITAMGCSRLYFYSQLIYKITGVLFILFGLRWGIEGMIWGRVFAYYLLFLMNAFISERIINYGLYSQIQDVFPNLIIAFISGTIIFCGIEYVKMLNVFIQVACISACYSLLYLLLSALTQNESFNYYLKFAHDFATRMFRSK